jgi:hypothetical protein
MRSCPFTTFCMCMQFEASEEEDATALRRALHCGVGCDSLAGFRVVEWGLELA